MYNALTVAHYVLKYSEYHNGVCSNLKLQKILYFLQAEFLVVNNEKLFYESIVASDFGPIVQEVYMHYHAYGGGSIPSSMIDVPNINSDDKVLIDSMLSELQDYDASTLTNISLHQTPWIKNYCHNTLNEIPSRDILEFFK